MASFKFGINDCVGYDLPFEDSVRIIKGAGFDAIFTEWRDDTAENEKMANIIAKNGLINESVHAPFGKMKVMWLEGEDGERYTDMLIRCVSDCQRLGIPVMTIHPNIGFNRHNPERQIGFPRFARLFEAAEKAGIKLAVENVEGTEYLYALYEEFGSSPAFGFCWDTGHEMCYNFSEDLMATFGKKLVATHFNDNMAMTDPDVVTWHDDAHMMPFDGVANWQVIMERIKREGYNGIINFEMTVKNKPEKHTHDRYAHMSAEEYFAEVYARAQKLNTMI